MLERDRRRWNRAPKENNQATPGRWPAATRRASIFVPRRRALVQAVTLRKDQSGERRHWQGAAGPLIARSPRRRLPDRFRVLLAQLEAKDSQDD